MIDSFIAYLANFPKPLATMILAAAPITELRFAIPWAITQWSVSPFNAFALGVIGSFLPVLPIYFGLDRLRAFITHHAPQLTGFVDRHISHAEDRLKNHYARYGAVALFLYVALPLPLTGAWSAAIAAVALKVPFRHAMLGIFLGLVLGGLIVTISTVSATAAFSPMN